jgi:PadR family transcriptional regulator, regulatory protein PadR
MAREPFSGHLDLLLLAALRGEPRHGYAVMEHVRRTSGGRFDYPEGTVYPALHRLEADGMLKSRWSEVDGRRRRVYELTVKGERALDTRRRDWERFSQSVAAVLGGT